MAKIALMGVGGKMGGRITDNLMKTDHDVRHVEISEPGIAFLKDKGLTAVTAEHALPDADMVIMAVPDVAIGKVAKYVVPELKCGAMVVALDPAAPLAGKYPDRGDITYFVAHPSHPSVFNIEQTPEAQRDHFGGTKAKQCVVCALMQGPDEDYAKGEALVRQMWAPVSKTYRITLEQMGLLEPALVETTTLTLINVMKQATDEVVRLGVPAEAAREFVLGHIHVELAIVFEEIDAQVSDGARLAMERAEAQLMQPDWKKLLQPDNMMEQIRAITG